MAQGKSTPPWHPTSALWELVGRTCGASRTQASGALPCGSEELRIGLGKWLAGPDTQRTSNELIKAKVRLDQLKAPPFCRRLAAATSSVQCAGYRHFYRLSFNPEPFEQWVQARAPRKC